MSDTRTLTLAEPVSHQSAAETEARTFGEIAQFAMMLEITCQDDLELAADALAEITRREKELDAIKRTATAPMNQALETIRGWFKPAEGHAALARKELKAKIGRYTSNLNQRALDASRLMKQAQLAGDTATVAKLHTALRPVEKIQGMQVREVWDCRIEDLSAIPREYFVVDLAAIRREMKNRDENGTPRPIPGVRFFKTPVIASLG